MPKKRWILFVIFLMAMGCTSLEPLEVREKAYGTGVPKITQSFASPRIRAGNTWKVYLNASDPDGDMKAIFSVIEQPGIGRYPVSITRIREENRKEISGYLYLNIVTPQEMNFINLTLTVQVQDKAGHFSAPALFPLAIQSQYTQEPAPPGIFKEEDLGPIMIRLRTTDDDHMRRRF